MISVKVELYEARSEAERQELRRILEDERKKPGFPEAVQVLIDETQQALTVIAIDPAGTGWTWGREFKPFTVTTWSFSSRP